MNKDAPLSTTSMPALTVLARAGNLVGGKYRLDSIIGYGGMGAVWMATHVTLGQRVALQIVSIVHSHSPDARQRFDLEAKAAARINSRHAVHVFDNGELDDGTPYIVMEYLEGESLDQQIRRDGPLSTHECGQVLVHVSRALAAAHAMKVIHRDIKPENIFLTQSPDEDGFIAKLLDFGIAKLLAVSAENVSTTRTGSVMGTPLYMSPEQARGLKSVDHRTDLYSLGAVAYCMLTGRQVFEAETIGDMVLRLCTSPLPKISAFVPGVPAAIEAWFERACARDPDERFQDVQEMVASYCDAARLSITGPVLVRRGSIADLTSTLQSGEYTARDTAPVPISVPDWAKDIPDSNPLLVATTGSERLASGSAHTLESSVPKRSRRSTFLLVAALSLLGASVLGLGIFIGTVRKVPNDPALVATSVRAELPQISAASSVLERTAEPAASIPSASASIPPANRPVDSRSASTASLPISDLNNAKVLHPKPAPKPSAKGAAGGAVDLGF